MLLSTSQMASFVGLKDENHKLEISNRQLERVSETRLLGAKFQENLKWNDHVKDIAKKINASYGVLHTISETLKLNWLPVEERRDYNLLKLTFKALHTKQWPLYLNLQRVPVCRCLGSLGSIKLQVPLEKGTFQDTAAALFNNLPDTHVTLVQKNRQRDWCVNH